jgi:hypothetical protein
MPVGVGVCAAVGEVVGDSLGLSLGEELGAADGKKISIEMGCVPPEISLTVVGSVPTVFSNPEGKVLLSISITVSPIGTSAMYIPAASIVKGQCVAFGVANHDVHSFDSRLARILLAVIVHVLKDSSPDNGN